MTRLSAFLTGLFWISVTFAQSLPADPSRSVPSERSSAASLQTPASLAVGRVSSTPQHPSPPTVEAAPGKSQPVPQADDPELPKTTELPNYDSHRCSQVLPRRGQCTKLPPQADTVEIAAQVAPRLLLAGREMMETMRPDHPERMERAHLALMGLSVGDAFGECFFGPAQVLQLVRSVRTLPPSPWHYTDDTEMALAVVEVLQHEGHIDQDRLASRFAERYCREPRRGYGGTAHQILRAISEGTPWQVAAGGAFSGMGSMGNGAAMRVAPLGAYFADEFSTVVAQARDSAAVTHAHPDGQAGAIAVAIAAAGACTLPRHPSLGWQILDLAIEHTPAGPTQQGLHKARALPKGCSVDLAVSSLGSGSRILSEDTVPFALWCVAQHPADFEAALWLTVSGLGDRDTTCAIVGGIVALISGPSSIPPSWLAAREPLNWG